MAKKRRQMTPEEDAAMEKRSRKFRELLERRLERDKQLAAERKKREAS
jgi:hypothetical protein